MAKQGAAQRAYKETADRPNPAGFRREDLAAYLRCTASGVDKLRSRGELPAPIFIGSTPFWLKAVIDDWLSAKAES